MSLPAHHTLVDWLPWSGDVFARAALERKPVLLSITAPWCHACHEMDRTTYADAEVAEAIRRDFVPVRVDSDRRPDLNERYNLGGWPTTAFLTPEGELLGGGTFIQQERMTGILARVRDAFGSRGAEIAAARAAGSSSAAGPASSVSVDDLIESVFATFDERCGGFGTEPKFPHVAPVRLALVLASTRAEGRYRQIAERTLEAMAGGALHDVVDGGFFRYATTRDWQLPHYEKLLEVNAALLGLYVEAAVTLGSTAFRNLATDIARYLTTRLADPAGGFYGSEDAVPEYYSSPDRTTLPRPALDRTLYADANAVAASALLEIGSLLEDDGLARRALQSLERVLLLCYRPGDGVAHCHDGEPGVRGLLWDQVAMIQALLDAYDLTGQTPYVMMAEELGHYMMRSLWVDEAGRFADRTETTADIGLLRDRRTPFVANCEAARAFVRLSAESGDHVFEERARALLDRVRAEALQHGPLAAHFILAVQAAGVR